jgi:hypothetical protein
MNHDIPLFLCVSFSAENIALLFVHERGLSGYVCVKPMPVDDRQVNSPYSRIRGRILFIYIYLHGTLYVNKGVFEFRMEEFSRNETEGSADILSRSSEKRLSLMTSLHKQAGTLAGAFGERC